MAFGRSTLLRAIPTAASAAAVFPNPVPVNRPLPSACRGGASYAEGHASSVTASLRVHTALQAHPCCNGCQAVLPSQDHEYSCSRRDPIVFIRSSGHRHPGRSPAFGCREPGCTDLSKYLLSDPWARGPEQVPAPHGHSALRNHHTVCAAGARTRSPPAVPSVLISRGLANTCFSLFLS